MANYKPPSEKQDFRREEILKAAESLFLEKGFHAASMIDIAKKTNISPAHIYNFYKNKSALAAAVQKKMYGACLQLIEKSVTQTGQKAVCKEEDLDGLFDTYRASLTLALLCEACKNEALRKEVVTGQAKLHESLARLNSIGSEDTVKLCRLSIVMSLFLGVEISRIFDDSVPEDVLKKELVRVHDLLLS